MAKTKNDIQLTSVSDKEKDTKVKSSTKKSKVKDEPLEPKVSKVAEPLDDVKVDVEIDLRSYNHSNVVGGYIRRKRSI